MKFIIDYAIYENMYEKIVE